MRPLKLPLIASLDLRPLEVKVREWNARGGLQLAIWSEQAFLNNMRRHGW